MNIFECGEAKLSSLWIWQWILTFPAVRLRVLSTYNLQINIVLLNILIYNSFMFSYIFIYYLPLTNLLFASNLPKPYCITLSIPGITTPLCSDCWQTINSLRPNSYPKIFTNNLRKKRIFIFLMSAYNYFFMLAIYGHIFELQTPWGYWWLMWFYILCAFLHKFND